MFRNSDNQKNKISAVVAEILPIGTNVNNTVDIKIIANLYSRRTRNISMAQINTNKRESTLIQVLNEHGKTRYSKLIQDTPPAQTKALQA